MKLNFEVFEKALKQLEKTMLYCEKEKDAEKKKMLRTACIKSFEYTYELAIKMLRRQLREMSPSPEFEQMSFRDFIRTGAEKGLIDAPEAWFEFKEKRNLTTHTYQEATAEEIYEILPGFVEKNQSFVTQLKKHNR